MDEEKKRHIFETLEIEHYYSRTGEAIDIFMIILIVPNVLEISLAPVLS